MGIFFQQPREDFVRAAGAQSNPINPAFEAPFKLNFEGILETDMLDTPADCVRFLRPQYCLATVQCRGFKLFLLLSPWNFQTNCTIPLVPDDS